VLLLACEGTIQCFDATPFADIGCTCGVLGARTKKSGAARDEVSLSRCPAAQGDTGLHGR
jgi:hypothetical protein